MRIFFYLVFLFFVPMKVLAHQQRPNFVLYFPDTIRAESVGTYGSFENMTNVTPEIEARFFASPTRWCRKEATVSLISRPILQRIVLVSFTL